MSEAEQIRVRLDWSSAETAQAQHVNQLLAQVGSPGSDGIPDGIYLTLGSVPPPAILDGDDDARDRLIEKLASAGAKVNVAGQFHISRRMLDDVIRVLQETAAKHDAAAKLGADLSRDPGA